MRQQLNLPKTTPRQTKPIIPARKQSLPSARSCRASKLFLRGVERIHPQDSAHLASKDDSAALAPRHNGGMAR